MISYNMYFFSDSISYADVFYPSSAWSNNKTHPNRKHNTWNCIKSGHSSISRIEIREKERCYHWNDNTHNHANQLEFNL